MTKLSYGTEQAYAYCTADAYTDDLADTGSGLRLRLRRDRGLGLGQFSKQVHNEGDVVVLPSQVLLALRQLDILECIQLSLKLLHRTQGLVRLIHRQLGDSLLHSPALVASEQQQVEVRLLAAGVELSDSVLHRLGSHSQPVVA